MLVETNPYSNRGFAVAGRLEVRPSNACARFVLRIAHDKLAQAEKALGSAIPPKIGELIKTGETVVACIGPDEWYIWTAQSNAVPLVAIFATLYESDTHSLVEVSHRETGIEITGPQSEWFLNAASPLDLSQMHAPGAARTVFDHAQIILVKWDTNHYRIEVWNSFADHVWTLLETVSHEIKLAV